MNVRTSAKAIIIRDGRLLCTKSRRKNGDIYYQLPGGGQERGEQLRDTLSRECMEEIAAQVEVKDLLFVREFIEKEGDKLTPEGNFHQVEFMFECKLKKGARPIKGINPDTHQIGVEWIELAHFDRYFFYPIEMKDILKKGDFNRNGVYLGAID